MSDDKKHSKRVFIGKICACFFCKVFFEIEVIAEHIKGCKKSITAQEHNQHQQRLKVLSKEQLDAYLEVMLRDSFECGHCNNGRSLEIESLCRHFSHCPAAKEIFAQRKNDKEMKKIMQQQVRMIQRSRFCALGPFCTVELAHIICFLLPQASGSQKKPPVGSERKRPAIVAKKEGKKNAEPTGKKPKESKANIRAEKVKEIPENKKTHKTLCMLMTYGDRTHSRVGIAGGASKQTQIASILSRPLDKITRLDFDYVRLLSMEDQCEVQAYTISTIQIVNNERHFSFNLASSISSFAKYLQKKWGGDIPVDETNIDWVNMKWSEDNWFDQITFDGVNMTDAYVQDAKIRS